MTVNILSLARSKIGKMEETVKGEWHGACPFCSSTHDAFMCWPDVGNFYCRKCGKEGWNIQFVMWTQGKSWSEAQAILGISSNGNGKHAVSNSEIAYVTRKHYADHKSIPESVLIKAKFQEIETYQGRPAMKYPTYDKDGKEWWRVRFMDGKSPKYKPVVVKNETTGEMIKVPAVWYRLQQAKGMSNSAGKPMVTVNGETSVLVAQHYGIPAICKTGGENVLPPHLLSELQVAYENSRPREIYIALDCDEKGVTTAKAIEKQLSEGKWLPTIIDLGFADKGDFADFCKLHTQDSAERLDGLVSASKPLSLNMHEASKSFTSNLVNRIAPEGKILVNPFKVLHHLGGDAEFMHPKRLSYFFSMSGHFKTAFWETIVDSWVQGGFSGIVDGQEFTKEDYHMRRTLRVVGGALQGKGKSKNNKLVAVTYRDVVRFNIHMQEERDNTPVPMRQGLDTFAGANGQSKLDTLVSIDKFVQSWIGHIEYVPYIFYLEDRIAFMRDWINKRRASGRTVEFAVFDYIQAMFVKSNDGGIHNYQYAAGLMKQFAIEMCIHVIAISQVNTEPSKQAKADNKRLATHDMHFVNENDCNLAIGLNFYYAKQTYDNGIEKTDYSGKPIVDHKILEDTKYIAAIVSVLKNSHGPKGMVQMPCDAKHLRWVDGNWGKDEN